MERFGWTPDEFDRVAEERPELLGAILGYMSAESKHAKERKDPKMGEKLEDNTPEQIEHWVQHRNRSVNSNKAMVKAAFPDG